MYLAFIAIQILVTPLVHLAQRGTRYRGFLSQIDHLVLGQHLHGVSCFGAVDTHVVIAVRAE